MEKWRLDFMDEMQDVLNHLPVIGKSGYFVLPAQFTFLF